MNWDQLLSTVRFYGHEFLTAKEQRARNVFQKDYDKLVFSPSFRRLQDKTQVFPLPGAVFVHNRLTHSLEVASVGRSLGSNVGLELIEKYHDKEWSDKLNSLDDIVAAACLAHDLGNPPFGHSGESAIISFFKKGAGQAYKDKVTPEQWADFTHFDGNANTFRVLTHQFIGHRPGGYSLTYTTLASVIKYPYPSIECTKKPKFGYFQPEAEMFHKVTTELGIPAHTRHPLCFLVEAADDICYQVMDIEDAHNLKLLNSDETIDLLMNFFDDEMYEYIELGVEQMDDVNARIAYLRSRVIGLLTRECTHVFLEHEEEILAGTFTTPLIDCISEVPKQQYHKCSQIAKRRIYRSNACVDVELAGYKIITELLEDLTAAVDDPENPYSNLLLDRMPSQYNKNAESQYDRLMAVLDFVSGMTDVYALELYRKINGMSLPSL